MAVGEKYTTCLRCLRTSARTRHWLRPRAKPVAGERVRL